MPTTWFENGKSQRLQEIYETLKSLNIPPTHKVQFKIINNRCTVLLNIPYDTKIKNKKGESRQFIQ